MHEKYYDKLTVAKRYLRYIIMLIGNYRSSTNLARGRRWRTKGRITSGLSCRL